MTRKVVDSSVYEYFSVPECKHPEEYPEPDRNPWYTDRQNDTASDRWQYTIPQMRHCRPSAYVLQV